MFPAYRPFKSPSQQRRRVQTRKLLMFSWEGEQYALPIEAVLRVIQKEISSDSLLSGDRLIQHQEMFVTVLDPARLLLKSCLSYSPLSSPTQPFNLSPNSDKLTSISTSENLEQVPSFNYLMICPFVPSLLPSADHSSASQVQDSNSFSLWNSGNGFLASAQSPEPLNYVGIPTTNLPTVLDISETAFQPLPDLYRNSGRSPGIEAIIYLTESQMLFYLNLSKLLLALKTE